MGLDPTMVVHSKAIGPTSPFHRVRPCESPRRPGGSRGNEREYPLLSPKEVNLAIRSRLGRRLVVLGAAVGTDAHTVGLDAILT